MWTSDLSVWQKSLASYIAAISERQHQKNKSGLAELDAFVQKELPSAIASRSPPHITSAEYSRVVQWKLKRGKWRPRLQAFADATTPCEVKEASQHAFSHLRNGQTKTALNTLTALKGCGPATASAILAAADPSIPFMSDELLTMTQGPKRSYTIKAYTKLIDDVNEKAKFLSEKDSNAWCANDVEKAVFSMHQMKSLSADALKNQSSPMKHTASTKRHSSTPSNTQLSLPSTPLNQSDNPTLPANTTPEKHGDSPLVSPPADASKHLADVSQVDAPSTTLPAPPKRARDAQEGRAKRRRRKNDTSCTTVKQDGSEVEPEVHNDDCRKSALVETHSKPRLSRRGVGGMTPRRSITRRGGW